jgi:hypothetical protein
MGGECSTCKCEESRIEDYGGEIFNHTRKLHVEVTIHNELCSPRLSRLSSQQTFYLYMTMPLTTYRYINCGTDTAGKNKDGDTK